MKILKLTAENIMRISAVEITPNGSPVVVIGGDNEAGKSAVLAAIEMALGGEKRLPSEPIRRGQASAKVIADLGDIIVTRRFTPSGTSLTVTNREGAKYPSPQALLDGLVGKLTFDPLAFAEADDKSQAETLRRLGGVDTTDLDLERKRLYDERTLINRDATQIQGAIVKALTHQDVGVEPVNAADVVRSLAKADELAATAVKVRAMADGAERDVTVAKARVKACTETVSRARQALEDAETAELEADEAVQQALGTLLSLKKSAVAAEGKVPDRTALRQQMADIDATNAKVRDNVARRTLGEQLLAKKTASEDLTALIGIVDMNKADRLAAAQFPVTGLGLDDTGVTWNGLPFSQASTAVRVRVSVAIGLALNPKLKVLLVRNGNDLGPKNLKLIADMAEEADAQLWIEKIDGGQAGMVTVVMEDGAVLASKKEAVSA